MGTSLLIFLVIIFVIAIIVSVTTYNSLITLKTRVREAASDIDVQLKRRYDLIPNLVETVKGSKNFEQETLEKVIQARNQAVSISGISSEKSAAENQLSGALRQLFALSENYPDLKSNQNYLALQTELTNTEDRILAARRFYNQVVTDNNAQQDQIPGMLFKGIAGMKIEPFFELENPTEERKNPQVKF